MIMPFIPISQNDYDEWFNLICVGQNHRYIFKLNIYDVIFVLLFTLNLSQCVFYFLGFSSFFC
jgi:hypothetical protein